jgi:5-methyltetrahydropteroyltriglutamate--homocysteine methyltransferase
MYVGINADPRPFGFLFAFSCGGSQLTAGSPALGMTKWFDTNYHYLVPELDSAIRFSLHSETLVAQVKEALSAGHDSIKVALVGPVSFLFLSKSKEANFDRLSLLPSLLPLYEQLVTELQGLGVKLVQLDEPILNLDITEAWQTALRSAVGQLSKCGVRTRNRITHSPGPPLTTNHECMIDRFLC